MKLELREKKARIELSSLQAWEVREEGWSSTQLNAAIRRR